MDIWIFFKAVFYLNKDRCNRARKNKAQDRFRYRGEAGEVIFPVVLALATGSILFGTLFWLNKHYEKKTKEHLSDFRENWNRLEKKYQN